MLTQSISSLGNLSTGQKTIPAIENRLQFARVLEASHISTILLRHCNLFDLRTLLERAYERDLTIYVNVDHIDGISPDQAGLHYLAEQLHITGIFSSNVKTLALAKTLGLETVQRIFAVDSTGLEVAFELVDSQYIDMLDISPALVIPHTGIQTPANLPFIGTGFISTAKQIQAILRAGAIGVTVSRADLWI